MAEPALGILRYSENLFAVRQREHELIGAVIQRHKRRAGRLRKSETGHSHQDKGGKPGSHLSFNPMYTPAPGPL